MAIRLSMGEKARAFVPAPPPPHPPIDWTPALRSKFDQALLALGRLDSVSTLLPDTSLFLFMYVRNEAVLSSMIEGTQPSLRLFREIHGVLLPKGRGGNQTPGEFRRSQNWIGGTRPGNAAFVPPPAEELLAYMSKLALFLHDQPEPIPVLLKAALAHVQFETIHPFLDGNGRLGRLLIALLLCEQKVLRQPMLYISLYFKTHRQYYYELLNNVRLAGDREAWLDFFAEAVIVTATQAVETAQQLIDLSSQDRDRIIANFSHTGDRRPPGNIHHMFIRLLIEIASIRIVKVEVEMPGIPHQDCPQTIPVFDKLKGMRIAPGFTSKVRHIIGGPRGCAHLTGLLMAMASAAIQGLWTYRAREPHQDEIINAMANDYLIDTCRVWRRDGPLVESVRKHHDEMEG